MVKKYTDNYRLDIAYATIFRNLHAIEEIPIHTALDITSGDNLTKKDMVPGEHIVYGGGGETGNTHSEFNIDYKTIGIGRVGARCGCVFEIIPNSWVTDNALIIQSYDKRFSLSFLRHFLSYSDLGQYANNAMQPVISKTRINDVTIPLIDIEEQNTLSKILDSIEKNEKFESNDYDLLKSKIKIIDNWETLNEEIEIQNDLTAQLKQSILQEAIQGKLTADWRAKRALSGAEVEPASELLKRIKAEKAPLIKDKKIKKEKPLPPISAADIPFEIPEGWVWCRIGSLYESLQYGTSKKCSYDDSQNTVILRIPNVSSGNIVLSDLKYTNLTPSEKKQYNLKENDLLIIRSNGSKEIVGKAIFVDKKCNDYGYAGYLIRLRFGSIINEVSRFLELAFSTYSVREQIEIPLRSTVGINNINSTEISNLVIPFPPLEEQKAIVEKVESLIQKCQALEDEIRTSEINAQRLMQAVLKEAFEGKKEVVEV